MKVKEIKGIANYRGLSVFGVPGRLRGRVIRLEAWVWRQREGGGCVA